MPPAGATLSLFDDIPAEPVPPRRSGKTLRGAHAATPAPPAARPAEPAPSAVPPETVPALLEPAPVVPPPVAPVESASGESAPGGVPGVGSGVVSEVPPEVVSEVAPAVVPEAAPAVVPEVVAEVVAEVVSGVVLEAAPEVIPEVALEVIPEVAPEVIPEAAPVALASLLESVVAEPESIEPAPAEQVFEPAGAWAGGAAEATEASAADAAPEGSWSEHGEDMFAADMPAMEPAPRVELTLFPMGGRSADPEATRRRLAVIEQRVSGCTRCELHQGRTRAVFARGNPEAELCFVGDVPGAEEDAEGSPFVGKAGQLLDRMIGAMGLGPEDVYITNVLRCRPPKDRVVDVSEVEACMPYLREQLEVARPRVIVALGKTAAKGLLNTNLGIAALRGKWKLYGGSIPVMPTFHPLYLLRATEQNNHEPKRDAWKDLQAVLERLNRPLPQRGRP